MLGLAMQHSEGSKVRKGYRSRDDQSTENRRLVPARVAEHRGWLIVQTYEDQGISGAKGRDQRPAFDQLLKDAVRRRYDI